MVKVFIPYLRNYRVVKIFQYKKNPKEFRQMLGVTGYYHNFIPAYVDLVQPLTHMTQKTVQFICVQNKHVKNS